jgi:hypothetical protein
MGGGTGTGGNPDEVTIRVPDDKQNFVIGTAWELEDAKESLRKWQNNFNEVAIEIAASIPLPEIAHAIDSSWHSVAFHPVMSGQQLVAIDYTIQQHNDRGAPTYKSGRINLEWSF